ncbi:MAG: phosphoribosylaminoimidazolesuccinocarboxamide synthase [Zetaproteobacteria bacterium]|nr:phosphoribosylaminoimidazolesuccinocarboxamide synthase [Zetaproteobacteria bacterium]
MAYSYMDLQNRLSASISKADVTLYQGKVRDCFATPKHWYMVHSDRTSAFDRMIAEVPQKGVILAALTSYWHTYFKDVVPSAYVSCSHPRVLKMERLKPIKIEMIVRGYLTGSLARAYKQGDRKFCGATLPDGLVEYGALPARLLTPTTKGDVGEHDENISPQQAIDAGLCTPEVWKKLESYSLQLFEQGSQLFATKGWILVDTKYEFGLDSEGEVRLMDEVHTPDSSRLWRLESYETALNQQIPPQAFDKDLIRRYLTREHGFTGEGVVPPVPRELLEQLRETYLLMAQCLIPGFVLPHEQEMDVTHFGF